MGPKEMGSIPAGEERKLRNQTRVVGEFEGRITDGEHLPMLDNEHANAAADELAVQQAMVIGFTREEAERLCRGDKICDQIAPCRWPISIRLTCRYGAGRDES